MLSEDMNKGAAYGSQYLCITFEWLNLSYLLCRGVIYNNSYEPFFLPIKISKTYVFILKRPLNI